ncbi:MAG: DNA polymerase III subunit beta [Candidatus Omnitrophica bacterium]|nr:DNA polymerase III subunit beta [Candidatus Omnitrophota bacterium]
MKVSINSSVLNIGLDYISEVLPSKPSMAICGGIHIEGKENYINLISTDLENTMKISIENEIEEKGEVVVPGKQFISLLKQFKDEKIEIERKEKFVNVIGKQSQYSFLEMEVEEFPKFPKITPEVSFKIKGEILKEGLKKIIFCIDPEEPRHQFRGGLIDIKEKNINMVGTDTRRLSLFILSNEQIKKQIKILLSYNLMKKLINILNEEEVEISIGKNNVSFQTSFTKTFAPNKRITGTILFVSQLLTGAEEFPDYEKVIPDVKKSKVAKINSDNFLLSLKRISLFTSERNNKVKLGFKKGLLTLSATGDIGEAREQIDIEYNDEDMEIFFPPSFLTDFLEVIKKDEFIFAFTASNKPVLMKPNEEENFLYVCMPLKGE